MEKITDQSQISHLILKIYLVPDPSSFNNSISVEEYSSKLFNKAFNYIKKVNDEEVGFISYYANDTETKTAYIALVGVIPEYKGKGIAQELMNHCIQQCVELDMNKIRLEVKKNNCRAIRFYEKNKFHVVGDASNDSVFMIKEII